MKFRNWINVIISIVMLIFSGYLLADSSVMSLDLLSNPNLNVAIELIRLFWGIVGLIYFLYYLYENIEDLFFKPVMANPAVATKSNNKKKRPRKRKRRRKTDRKKSKTISK